MSERNGRDHLPDGTEHPPDDSPHRGHRILPDHYEELPKKSTDTDRD